VSKENLIPLDSIVPGTSFTNTTKITKFSRVGVGPKCRDRKGRVLVPNAHFGMEIFCNKQLTKVHHKTKLVG
jgi:hypothetical protein